MMTHYLLISLLIGLTSADFSEPDKWISAYNSIFETPNEAIDLDAVSAKLKDLNHRGPKGQVDSDLLDKILKVELFAIVSELVTDCVGRESIFLNFGIAELKYGSRSGQQNANAIALLNALKRRQWSVCEKQFAELILQMDRGLTDSTRSNLNLIMKMVRELKPADLEKDDELSSAITEYLMKRKILPDEDSFSFNFSELVTWPCSVFERDFKYKIDTYNRLVGDLGADQMSQPKVKDFLFISKICRRINASARSIERQCFKNIQQNREKASKPIEFFGKLCGKMKKGQTRQ